MSAASELSVKVFALAYAELGYQVFPVHSVVKFGDKFFCTCRHKMSCQSPGKHPVARLAPQGLKNASSDPVIVKAMFSGFGQHNIGIATGSVSKIIVLDIDPRHGGGESLQALEAKHSKLPETLRWHTGGGGEHILFQHPGDTIGNSAGNLGNGIDVRGDGGYIVAPPSRHVSGGIYRLPNGKALSTPPVALPAWLHQLVRQGGGHNRSLANKPTIAELAHGTIPDGQRNTSIARLSGHLLAKHVDPHIVLDLMAAFNEARCSPPLDAKEVAGIVASIDHRAFTQLINRN